MKRINPFSNGFEYRSWADRNCDKCKKYENQSTKIEDAGCKLAFYLDLGSVSGEGVPENVLTKFGCKIEDGFLTECKKREHESK